jgi:hypothetical protein
MRWATVFLLLAVTSAVGAPNKLTFQDGYNEGLAEQHGPQLIPTR